MLWNDLSRRMPALLITMSTRPNASSAVCTIASPPSGVATELRVGDRLAAGGLDLLRPPCCAGPSEPPVPSTAAAEVVDDDLRAARGEEERVLAAEAAARAGDDRNLAVETEVSHGG